MSASLTDDTMSTPKYEVHELANLSVSLSNLLERIMGKTLLSVGVGNTGVGPEFVVYVRKGRSLGQVPDDHMGIPIRVVRLSSVTY